MKQWFDVVFEYGWAYGSTGTALQGKEVMLVASLELGKMTTRETAASM